MDRIAEAKCKQPHPYYDSFSAKAVAKSQKYHLRKASMFYIGIQSHEE